MTFFVFCHSGVGRKAGLDRLQRDEAVGAYIKDTNAAEEIFEVFHPEATDCFSLIDEFTSALGVWTIGGLDN